MLLFLLTEPIGTRMGSPEFYLHVLFTLLLNSSFSLTDPPVSPSAGGVREGRTFGPGVTTQWCEDKISDNAKTQCVCTHPNTYKLTGHLGLETLRFRP